MKIFSKNFLYISILFLKPAVASSDVMENFRYLDPKNGVCETYTETQLYPKFITGEGLELANGGMLNFAAAGPIGKVIRAASAQNDIPNPLGLTHSGIVIIENPRWLFSKVLALTPDQDNPREDSLLSKKAGDAIMRELLERHRDVISMPNDPGIFRPFSIESDGSAKDVLSGIAPQTRIYDLYKKISDYDGNIYYRPLFGDIPSRETRDFIENFLGRPYESIFNLRELVRATKCLNQKERTENVFCSELAACFYKKCGLIDVNVSNAIPEYFGSAAGDGDILGGIAGEEVALKVKQEFKQSDIEGRGCCGLAALLCMKAD